MRTSPEPLHARFSTPAAEQKKNTLIHPLACVVLIACDYLWTTVEWAMLLWVVTIPLTFIATTIPVYLIQRRLNEDGHKKAVIIAGTCGILAALPTPIMGTVAGAGFLAVAGIKRLSN